MIPLNRRNKMGKLNMVHSQEINVHKTLSLWGTLQKLRIVSNMNKKIRLG